MGIGILTSVMMEIGMLAAWEARPNSSVVREEGSQGSLEDAVEENSSPVLSVGTTGYTFMKTFPLPHLYASGAANMQFVINDHRDTDRNLGITFRIADDDLTEVKVWDNTLWGGGNGLIYEKDLDGIVGTVNGRLSYSGESNPIHLFRIVARDASGNTTSTRFITYKNDIILGLYPRDDESPLVVFADKDYSWFEKIAGEDYEGLVMLSDKTDHVLPDGDDMGASPMPEMYGFSARVFDQDTTHLTLEVNNAIVFDREFEEDEYLRRRFRNPAEVHLLFTVPRDGHTYTIRVTATDGAGNVTVEEREVTAPY